MHLKITHVNINKDCGYADYTLPLDPKETTKQKLFKSLMEDFGKPVSKVYIGDRHPTPIGWVFHKRRRYDDCNEFYLCETWVVIEETKTTAININTLKFGE
jgi:hypothetical protein